MRHKKKTFKIGRTAEHRGCLVANMVSSLVLHGRVITTPTKAKEVGRVTDKMVTHAKVGDLHNRRLALVTMRNLDAVRILFDEIGPRMNGRQGGYTRIIRLGNRRGDGAATCLLELVGNETAAPVADSSAEKKA